MYNYPMFNKKGESQMDTDNTLDKLVINAKIIALYDLKKKIDKEIEDLESQKEDTDEIPF